MPVLTEGMTIEEYFTWVEMVEGYYELIEGEPRLEERPVPIHQEVVGNIAFSLEMFFRQNPVGEVFLPIDVQANEATIIHPDLISYHGEDLERLPPGWEGRRPISGIKPAIVVEVLSPSTRDWDL